MKLFHLAHSISLSVAISACLSLCIGSTAQASVVALSDTSFGAPQVTFSEVAIGTGINGLTINGFGFSETILNTFVNSGGPLNTNNISQPSALGNANPFGEIITINMPSPTSAFGFGYAILTSGTVADAVTVTLFDGLNNVGSIIFSGSPDPIFSGGFAGLGSTNPFTSVQLTFSQQAGAFDFDNLRANAAAVPEPANLALMGLGLAGMAYRRRKSM